MLSPFGQRFVDHGLKVLSIKGVENIADPLPIVVEPFSFERHVADNRRLGLMYLRNSWTVSPSMCVRCRYFHFWSLDVLELQLVMIRLTSLCASGYIL